MSQEKEVQQYQCAPHNDPDNYVESPSITRSGWKRITCSVCGRFIGYMPPNTGRADKPRTRKRGAA